MPMIVYSTQMTMMTIFIACKGGVHFTESIFEAGSSSTITTSFKPKLCVVLGSCLKRPVCEVKSSQMKC